MGTRKTAGEGDQRAALRNIKEALDEGDLTRAKDALSVIEKAVDDLADFESGDVNIAGDGISFGPRDKV